jgi:hypothetical protein
MTAQLLTGLLTGLFALAGSVIVLVVQGRQQRSMAQDERLWTRRAETYVAVLRFQGGGMVEWYQGPRGAEEWAVRDELTAKVAAFASDEVRELWQQSALAALKLDDYCQENWPEACSQAAWEDVELAARMEKDETFRRLRQASDDARRRLAERVRAELDTDDSRGRSPRNPTWPTWWR